MTTANDGSNSTTATNKSERTALSYRDAGVDIDAGNALVENIKAVTKRTHRPEVMSQIGGFGALCERSPQAIPSQSLCLLPTALARNCAWQCS